MNDSTWCCFTTTAGIRRKPSQVKYCDGKYYARRAMFPNVDFEDDFKFVNITLLEFKNSS